MGVLESLVTTGKVSDSWRSLCFHPLGWHKQFAGPSIRRSRTPGPGRSEALAPRAEGPGGGERGEAEPVELCGAGD